MKNTEFGSLANHPDLRRAVKAGKVKLAPKVPPCLPLPFYGAKRADEEMAMLSFAIGENLVARRSEDVALAARAFADLAGVKRVALEAVGAAAIPAAHAYFLERAYFASFASEATPSAWRKVLSDPEIPFAFADTVHGALRVYDWVDLVR